MNQSTTTSQTPSVPEHQNNDVSNLCHDYKKSARLLKPAEFRHVFDKPDKKLHASHIMAFIRKNEQNHPRLGLAITKKKVPTAVGRNKLKRIVRENFRQSASLLKSVDIVFIAKRPINELSKAELHEQTQQILQKIHQNYQSRKANAKPKSQPHSKSHSKTHLKTRAKSDNTNTHVNQQSNSDKEMNSRSQNDTSQ